MKAPKAGTTEIPELVMALLAVLSLAVKLVSTVEPAATLFCVTDDNLVEKPEIKLAVDMAVLTFET